MTTTPRPDHDTPRCHPDPQLRGGADGCPYIEPCTQRCHIRWLDGDEQLTAAPEADDARP